MSDWKQVHRIDIAGAAERPEDSRVTLAYVEELEQRLRLACEPCADCGHIDYRELDDVLDREGVTRYSAPKEKCEFGCGWSREPANAPSREFSTVRASQFSYTVVAGCPVHDLASGGAVTPADVPTGRSEGADTPEAGAKESSGSEREQELTNLLRKAREQFAYIEQEAYSDNQAMKVIRACQIAFEQIDAALAPAVEEQR